MEFSLGKISFYIHRYRSKNKRNDRQPSYSTRRFKMSKILSSSNIVSKQLPRVTTLHGSLGPSQMGSKVSRPMWLYYMKLKGDGQVLREIHCLRQLRVYKNEMIDPRKAYRIIHTTILLRDRELSKQIHSCSIIDTAIHIRQDTTKRFYLNLQKSNRTLKGFNSYI